MLSRLLVPLLALPLLMSPPAQAAETAEIAIIPRPLELKPLEGNLQLGTEPAIHAPESFQAEAQVLANLIHDLHNLSPRLGSAAQDSVITFEHQPGDETLGTEGYRLEITPQSVRIQAATPTGAFYATQTLRQLLMSSDDASLPGLRILDRPRYEWRGMMLDPARRFVDPDYIKRFIDLMAFHKLNQLHLHLTDDQSWTIPIEKHPRLTDQSLWKWPAGDRRNGVYTRAQIRDIVDYAAAHHVMVIPEIEMPSHAYNPLAAMPELMCPNNPWRTGERSFDKIDEGHVEMCPGSEYTFQVLQDILTEVAQLFPDSPYIHIGGDEYYGIAWANCPLCQQRIKDENLQAEMTPELEQLYAKCKGDPQKHLLYRYLMRRVAGIVRSLDRTPILWDDLAWRGNFPEEAVIQQWHYKDGWDAWQRIFTPNDPAVEAVSAGHPVVVSIFNDLYFDYDYVRVSTERVYRFDPTPAQLSPDQKDLILGPEAPIWNYPQSRLDRQAYPRACALAETGWSNPENRDWDDFQARLQAHLPRLKALGVDYYVPIVINGPIVGEWTLESFNEGEQVEMTFDITPYVTKPGQYNVVFDYQTGSHGVNTLKAVILADGKEVASDNHRGWTGAVHRDRFYRLELPTINPDAKYTLLVQIHASKDPTHQIVDSMGHVVLQPPDIQ